MIIAIQCSAAVNGAAGFEPRELIGRSVFELVHPDEFPRVKQMHQYVRECRIVLQ